MHTPQPRHQQASERIQVVQHHPARRTNLKPGPRAVRALNAQPHQLGLVLKARLRCADLQQHPGAIQGPYLDDPQPSTAQRGHEDAAATAAGLVLLDTLLPAVPFTHARSRTRAQLGEGSGHGADTLDAAAAVAACRQAARRVDVVVALGLSVAALVALLDTVQSTVLPQRRVAVDSLLQD